VNKIKGKDRVIKERKKRKITNNYPLPLISDIVENISTKEVFRLVMGI